MVQVKSATKEGFETASEGDSINLSMPNSKTRRGRVGVGVAQTLDTQANQSVVVSTPTHGRAKGREYENETPTLQQQMGTGGNNIPYVNNIRRLTEIECERLQGFYDNHTQYGLYPFKKIGQKVFNKLPNDEKVKIFETGLLNKKLVSKGQRYKICGNAVTVDIVQLIASKLLPSDEIILIDLFAGIGGFTEGLIRAGFKISHHYFSEIDLHAIANYKYNFNHAEYIGSVTDVCGKSIRKKHPTAKIIVTGGFPCQDISIAGNRKGLTTGTRSSLLFEAGRIINELQCEHFIIENVKGLSSVNEGTGIIKTITFLTYLNSDSPQYTVDVQLFNTKWILPQNRERYYFVGSIGTGGIKRILPVTENDCRIIEGSGETRSVRTITGGGHSGGMHSSMTLLRVSTTGE